MSHVIHVWVMSHIWMSHVIHECVMSHVWMSHVIHMNESCHTYEWVISHIWMSHVTHMNESCLISTNPLRFISRIFTSQFSIKSHWPEFWKTVYIHMCVYINMYKHTHIYTHQDSERLNGKIYVYIWMYIRTPIYIYWYSERLSVCVCNQLHTHGLSEYQ